MKQRSIQTISRVGRPSDRQDQIVQELRDKIVAGHLSPGSRLPTRDEISQMYGAGPNTVQRALDRLRHDGFILTSGRNGSHVSPEPPHLTRYALVFPSVPTCKYSWVRFWTALNNEAFDLQRNENIKLPSYYAVSRDPNKEDYQRLLQDVYAHRVAGIIFASSAYELIGSPILEEPGIPRVAIKLPSNEPVITTIFPDPESLLDKALSRLKQHGCQRVAFVSPWGLFWSNAFLNKKVNEAGMETRPYWNQTVPLENPQSAQNLVHLMMNPTQSERPDALIISDDNFVEHATAGLLSAGVNVPDEVQVIAHCNFPWPTTGLVPMERIGFDAREILQASIKVINQMRQGEEPAPVTKIPTRFEDELKRFKSIVG